MTCLLPGYCWRLAQKKCLQRSRSTNIQTHEEVRHFLKAVKALVRDAGSDYHTVKDSMNEKKS